MAHLAQTPNQESPRVKAVIDTLSVELPKAGVSFVKPLTAETPVDGYVCARIVHKVLKLKSSPVYERETTIGRLAESINPDDLVGVRV